VPHTPFGLKLKNPTQAGQRASSNTVTLTFAAKTVEHDKAMAMMLRDIIERISRKREEQVAG